AHHSCRAGASSPIFDRSHRRTKNSVRRFTKAKTSPGTAIVKVVALWGLAAVAPAATLKLFDLTAAHFGASRADHLGHPYAPRQRRQNLFYRSADSLRSSGSNCGFGHR